MSLRIVAWYVPDWHLGGNGPEWQTFWEPMSGREFETFMGEQDDDGAEEGTFVEGLIRLTDGREVEFSVEKSFCVDYSLNVDDDPEQNL